MNYYKFGGLNVIICGADQYFKDTAKAYETAFFENYDIKINLRKTDCVKIPQCSKIGEMPYIVVKLSWYSDGETMYMAGFNTPTSEYIFCAEIDKAYKNITVDMLDIKHDIDDTLYIKNVLDLVIRFVVLKHSRINIHSSSIAYNNKGVLFSAPSGTGKSTHTALWQKLYPETVIVNDDYPLISVGDEIVLNGTPWSGTSGVNNNISVPLKAIVFLRRGQENTIERLNAAASMRYLIDEIFKTPVADIASVQLDLIGKILSNVPAYLLKCSISDEAVEAVKKVL